MFIQNTTSEYFNNPEYRPSSRNAPNAAITRPKTGKSYLHLRKKNHRAKELELKNHRTGRKNGVDSRRLIPAAAPACKPSPSRSPTNRRSCEPGLEHVV
jgi:hypothetical protein